MRDIPRAADVAAEHVGQIPWSFVSNAPFLWYEFIDVTQCVGSRPPPQHRPARQHAMPFRRPLTRSNLGQRHCKVPSNYCNLWNSWQTFPTAHGTSLFADVSRHCHRVILNSLLSYLILHTSRYSSLSILSQSSSRTHSASCTTAACITQRVIVPSCQSCQSHNTIQSCKGSLPPIHFMITLWPVMVCDGPPLRASKHFIHILDSILHNPFPHHLITRSSQLPFDTSQPSNPFTSTLLPLLTFDNAPSNSQLPKPNISTLF